MQIIKIADKAADLVKKGYLWVHSGSIISNKDVAPGLVHIYDTADNYLATGYYNSKVKIACRILSRDIAEDINENFFHNKFNNALNYRTKYFNTPFYRLINAEGDRMPGLIIDCMGDTLICQVNTLGMEQLQSQWLPALEKLLTPKVIILRNDVPTRLIEGLEQNKTVIFGHTNGLLEIEENGLKFFCEPLTGQKTGWFFDQRANRAMIGKLADNKRVLDLYSYLGGFGINALKHGATAVTFVDASKSAIELIRQNINNNFIRHDAVVDFINDDVFSALQQLIDKQQKFDLVIADPPAFIKAREHKNSGLKGYQKLAKLTAMLVAKSGYLFIASCSQHANLDTFKNAVTHGIHDSNNNAIFLQYSGADRDHPTHPMMPHTQYLKGLLYQM